MTNKMERFTYRARHVLSVAQQEAEALNHHAIGTQHLLLGLIREKSDISGVVLDELKVELDASRALAVELTSSEPPTSRLDIAPDTKRLLERAVQEARALKHEFIGTEHLLMALTYQHDSIGAVILTLLDVELADVRKRIIRQLRRQEREVLRPGTRTPSSLIRRRFARIPPTPTLDPQPNPEVTQILNMIRDGKITAESGEKLIRALSIGRVFSENQTTIVQMDMLIAEDDPRYVRVVITDKATGQSTLDMHVAVIYIPKAFEAIIHAVNNNLEGNISILDEDTYRVDFFLDRPADEEAS